MTTDKDLRERLARRLCYTNCEEFGEKSPACPSLKCDQHGLFFKEVDALHSELAAAGYAVVRKELTKEEQLKIRNEVGGAGGFYPSTGLVQAVHLAMLAATKEGQP